METDIWNGCEKPDLRRMTTTLRRFLAHRTCSTSCAPGPRISIITPSLNQARYLERTLLSILNQGYANLELIVVDGGSTDGSVDILRQYSDALAHWSSEPDRGQSHAINKGLGRVTGQWIAFQNSDDILLPGALKEVARIQETMPDADVVTGHMVHIDSTSVVFDVQLALQPSVEMQIALGGQLHNQATFWRRDLMLELGGMRQDMKFCFDYEYFTRMLLYAKHPVVSDRYLGAFRRHKESKTTTMLSVGKEEHAMAVAQFRRTTRLPLHFRWAPKRLLRAVRGFQHLLQGRGWYLTRRLPPPVGIGARH